MIQFDSTFASAFLPANWAAVFTPRLNAAHRALEEGSGAGAEYTGWLRLPETCDREELRRIKEAAGRIRSDSEALVVIGIGGSYLGARGAIELLRSPQYNLLRKETPQIFFAGNTLSAAATAELLELLEGRDFSVNVISKSGTTTEPAISFRLFRGLLEKRYGKEGARGRIYVTTDREKGALRAMADREGYESFSVPDNIGGRYSVLTAVGLLPMAAAGIDIEAVLAGAAGEMDRLRLRAMDNPAWQYAAVRNALYETAEKLNCSPATSPPSVS
jgi:glucose-6-phosphate isomerase